ncbi:hypothetical protein A3K73_08080 [Candidatus Pacearchaeota archaeon RBG_13_36_9]|nr:MAG: hypothetical protein A3K73_08080 [Candidatus Pacearchaeota archaeon RBG_13_36_9]
MLKKDELKVLKVLFSDFTKSYTIRGLSKELNQKYVQTYRTVNSLENSNNILIEKIGNSKVARLNFTEFNLNYPLVEVERLKDYLKDKSLEIIYNRIINLHENVLCLLFGSQVKRTSIKSDFDLLFVIPEQFEHSSFERKVKNQLTPYNCDINIVTEKGLLNMWGNPKKLNVGNELLKSHVVLYGAEHFLNLLRKHYKGEE